MKNETTVSAGCALARETALRAAGGSDFAFDYNLDRGNRFIEASAVIHNKKIYLYPGSGAVVVFDTADADSFRLYNGIGCVSIEYTKDGEDFELCRSDMKNSPTMQAAVKKLTAIKENRGIGGGELLICPTCGRALPQGSTICMHCLDQKKIFARLIPMMKPYVVPLSAALAMLILISAVNIVFPIITKILIDDYIKPKNPDKTVFLLLIGAMAAGGLIVAAANMGRRIIIVKSGNKLLVALREQLYRKIQELSLAGISKKSAGELIRRVTHDTENLKDFIVDLFQNVLQTLLIIIGTAVIMFVMNWRLALLVIIPVPLMFLLFASVRKRTGRLYHRQWQLESHQGSLLHDVFTGMRVVKVFGTEKKEEQRFSDAARNVADTAQKNELLWNLMVPFTHFLISFGEYAVLIIAGNSIISGGMQLGELLQYMTYVQLIYGPISWMAFLPRRLAWTATSIAKVYEIMDERSDVVDCAQPVEKELAGNISFKNACFGYNSYEYVLKNVSLDINNGEMVGIVGRSGVGKTTIINLIMRLYDLTAGELTVDGTDIKDYSQTSLRSGMGVVLQETFLFNGTIFANISYAKPEATREEVIRASKLANAHEFIMKQPDGYNTYVGDRGNTLSGGEKQRLAIARAILRNPKILILDEATASLDTETEKQIQDALNRLITGRTTIAIAHRLSTLRNATKLIVLEKGEVEEIGTHEELMRNQGRYYSLVMAQRQMNKLKK